MERSETLGQLATAKAQAQAKFLPIGKDKEASVFSKRTGNTFTYTYADLASCLDAVMPALSEFDLAIFQPVRVREQEVIATTLLVHGASGEWISEDYSAPVADAADARSVGSAATYARRYGLQGLLGIAPHDEDDDAESARGGQHEMAPQGSKACPVCAVVGSIIKGKVEYGGGWICWKGKGGCGTKWPEGGDTSVAPVEQELMPRRKGSGLTREEEAEIERDPRAAWDKLAKPSASEQATTGAPGVASAPRGEVTTGAGFTKPKGARGKPVVTETEPQGAIPDVGMSTEAETAPEPGTQTEFTIGPTKYVTNGLTEAQLLETFRLVPAVDRAHGKGAARKILAEMFTLTSRTDLTQAQGEAFIKALYAKLPEQGA